MLRGLFKKLFGTDPNPPAPVKSAVPQPRAKKSAPNASSPPIPPKPRLLPVDLDIGLDLGTSCTKAVIGDREANRQTAVPLNLGRDLRGYLLPTRVYVVDGAYSLEDSAKNSVRRDLKMRIMESANRGGGADHTALCDFTAFAALSIRRILDWYHRELAASHPNREPVWHLNVGLPSQGGKNDKFDPIYRRLMRAAVRLVPGDAPITRELAQKFLGADASGEAWLPDARLKAFPEAGAQLASLILSPHRPTGCLLVVDVGAGTIDISTLRIGGDATAARCTMHVCEVAPLGVQYLFLARRGHLSGQALTPDLLTQIPDDDGIHPIAPNGNAGAPTDFVNRCKNAILPVVSRYRHRLKEAHESPAFRPWAEGLPYVLSGGGRRDPFYQNLLGTSLEAWLATVVSEWDRTLPAGPHRGLIRQNFPTPRSFAPKVLLRDFDRFSVAHGLSLGADGLMEIRAALD